MAAPIPSLALRGTQGVSLLEGPPALRVNQAFRRDDSRACKVMAFSPDGSLFAWCNGQQVTVVRLPGGEVVHQMEEHPRVVGILFSPLSTYMATWEVIVGKGPPYPNLHLWDIKTGQKAKSFVHKRQTDWEPQWTDDEALCAHAVNEIHLFENGDFSHIARKLDVQKVAGYRLSPGPPPHKIAVYVPGQKGGPSFVRVFKCPDFATPLANKSFFKADKADIRWNKKGTGLLVLCATEVDQTGQSYYGEQNLHYIGVDGVSSIVQLSKNGPIYSTDWSPDSTEFCVVYGFMPAKATIFNLKCEPVFDFGTGPRNLCAYNPQGNILALAGFGNLRGNIEVWDRRNLQKIALVQAPDTTYFAWSPNGSHFVTATTSPRLRVGNGYKIWHYTGHQLDEKGLGMNDELWEVAWQTYQPSVFPETRLSYQPAKAAAQQQEAKPAVYRPPGARALGHTSPTKLHEEELPQNERMENKDENLSKAALKNKKKREAKKAKQQQQQQAPMDARSQEQRDALAMATHILGTPPPSVTSTVVSADSEKKIKGLKKKLRQIEQLKEQQKSGKKLESNQLEKIKGEAALLKELEELELGS
ncbi:eukaryotic translation initiation factor 2A-like [Branchiostoma floridae x Branchiostoma belcheri]